jgi:elongation of very long chain fatty acids protein 6
MMATIINRTAEILFQFPLTTSFKFERDFHHHDAVAFARNNWPLAIGISAAYLFAIFYGRHLMKQQEPFELRVPLAMWNAFLSVFSFIGMCRTMSYLAASILTKSLEDTICSDPAVTWGNGPVGLWVMLFIFSKIPELVDTVFIVLRKKPLIFLHWYHHVSVLLFCWNCYAVTAASGLWFVAMNYSVHSLMYGYYCVSGLGQLPKWFPVWVITLSQIAQMFVGTGVCVSAWYYMLIGKSCHNDMSSLIAGAVMYGSYLYLFVDFAVGRYIVKGKRDKKRVKEDKLK